MANILPTVEKALSEYGLDYTSMECDTHLADTAAFCKYYKFDLSESANTIIVASRTDPIKYAACVVLATTRLDVNKKVCQLLNVKKASFANGDQTVDKTGMMIGGVTVFGIETMPIYVDSQVFKQRRVVMGGGNRESKIILDPAQLNKLPNIESIEGLAKVNA